MTLAYRSGSVVTAGNASGGNLTLNRPTGTADGDRLVVVVYFEPDTTTITISPGTWESVAIANTGAFKLQAFTKIAASEPTSYTIANSTAGNQWRAAVGAAYAGGTGTGTLIDVSATAQADGVAITDQTAPSVTTTGPDRLVAFGYGNFSGNDGTATTGFCANFRASFGGTILADAALASAGATGTSRPSAGGIGSEIYAALHAALISDLGGGAATSLPPPRPGHRQQHLLVR